MRWIFEYYSQTVFTYSFTGTSNFLYILCLITTCVSIVTTHVLLNVFLEFLVDSHFKHCLNTKFHYCNCISSCQQPLFLFSKNIRVCIFLCFPATIQTYHSRTGFEPLDFRKSLDLSPPLWAATWAAAARLLQLLLKNPFPEGPPGPPRPGPLGPPPSIKAVVAVSLSLTIRNDNSMINNKWIFK